MDRVLDLALPDGIVPAQTYAERYALQLVLHDQSHLDVQAAQ